MVWDFVVNKPVDNGIHFSVWCRLILSLFVHSKPIAVDAYQFFEIFIVDKSFAVVHRFTWFWCWCIRIAGCRLFIQLNVVLAIIRRWIYIFCWQTNLLETKKIHWDHTMMVSNSKPWNINGNSLSLSPCLCMYCAIDAFSICVEFLRLSSISHTHTKYSI